MKDITGFRNKRLVALRPTDERKYGCVVWECQCDCGNIIKVPGSYLTNGKKGSCGCLEQENKENFGQRTKNNNSKDITGQQFGRLTVLYPTEKRSGTNVIWHCLCECGNECDVSIGHLGKSIFSCGCLRQEIAKQKGLNQILDLTGQKFGKLTVIQYSKDDNKSGSQWECLCECGNKVIVSGNSLKKLHTLSCGCLKQSHGEFQIKTLLKENNINYITEYKNNTCRFPDTKALARFDFGIIVDNKLSYLIEYDGEQHFKDTGFKTSLEYVQQHDEYKNQWCKDNNIPLIRIPYTHLQNLCIADLQLSTTQFLS